MFTNQSNDLNPVQIARAHMINKAPFYASIALKLLLQEIGIVEGQLTINPCYGGFATDGRSLIWSQELMDRLTDEEVQGLIAHESLHIVMKHHLRRGDRNPILWNVAADLIVNRYCNDEGFTVPRDSVRTYEEGVEYFLNMCPDVRLVTFRKPTEVAGVPGLDTHTEQVYENLVALIQKQNPNPKPKQQGQGQPGQGLPGAVLDYPAETKEKLQQAEIDLDMEIAQAIYASSARGLLPGHAKGLLNEVTRPKIDWRESLREWFSNRTQGDFSYSRPNRRYAGCNIIMPVMDSVATLRIAIATDTSGSVSDGELNQYLGEISSIIEDCRADVLFIQCDAKVNYAEWLTREDLPLAVTVHGRGGTDFLPVFKYLEDNNDEVGNLDGIIYLTDGKSDYDGIKDPGIPLLWVYSRKTGYRVSPIGDHIYIEV